MSNLIGLFDSGLGGLTVLKQVLLRYPDLPCVYLADTARLPYGEKHKQEIRLIADEVISWLNDQDIGIILVACNTTNSLAIDIIKSKSNVPVLDLITAAGSMIKSKRIGILATPATVSSHSYKSHIQSILPEVFVLEQSCPGFVPLIEEGITEGNLIRRIAENYLKPLIDADVSEIILACSHYPLIEPVLRDLIPSHISFIDPAVALSKHLDNYVGKTMSSSKKHLSLSNIRLCSTSDPENFSRRAASFLGQYPDVELISLRSKACFF